MTDKNILKNWFKTGLKPTQNQFWAWIDSFWHKDGKIPIAQIDGIDKALESKAEQSDLTFKANINASNISEEEAKNWRLKTGVLIGTADSSLGDNGHGTPSPLPKILSFYEGDFRVVVKRLPYAEFGDQNLKFADAKYRNLKTFNAFFSTNILYDHEVPGTLTSSGTSVYWNEKRGLNATELRRMSTFPSDFDFCGVDVRYICGMSVPPFMIQRIAEQIKLQWF